MTYAVQNVYIFQAAYAGALAGMSVQGRQPVDSNSADYLGRSQLAGAWAQALDTVWGASANELDVDNAETLSSAFWSERQPLPFIPYLNPSFWLGEANTIAAMMAESEVYFASIGVTPAPIPGSGGGSGGITGAILDATSTAVVPGDSVTTADVGGGVTGNVVRAQTSTLNSSQNILGVVLFPAPPGGIVFYQFAGTTSTTVTGLGGAATATLVTVNPATGRLRRVSPYLGEPYVIGCADPSGELALFGCPQFGTAAAQVINVRGAPYGAVGDDTHDDTAAIDAAIAAAGSGSIVYVPRGIYKYTGLLQPTAQPIAIVGEGDGPNQLGTVIRAHFSARLTGNAASFTSVANNTGNDDGNVLVTITGLTGVTAANTPPGSVIQISGAASETNNFIWTIVSVPAPGSVIAYCFYFGTHTVFSGTPTLPVVPDANNGALTWTIGKTFVQGAAIQDLGFFNITFDGNGTVGTVIDASNAGTNGVPNNAAPTTAWRFRDMKAIGGLIGLKIGDFSTYVAGNVTTAVTYPNNCDLFTFDNCTFRGTVSAIHIPSSTFQSKLHHLIDCNLQNSQYGWNQRSGSVQMDRPNFTSNSQVDFNITRPSDAIAINGGSSEHSARHLCLGVQGYASGFTGQVPFTETGMRADVLDSEISADGRYIQIGFSGGVKFQGCTFSAYGTFPVHGWHIAINTIPESAGARSATFSAEGCTFPTIAISSIVQRNSTAPAWWYSKNNMVTVGTTGAGGTPVPDGLLECGNGNATSTAPGTFPSTQVPLLCMSEQSQAITNGVHNDYPNPYNSALILTGATGAVTLTGIVAPNDVLAQTLDIMFDFNQQVTIANNSGLSTAGNRILTPTGADLLFPPAGAFATVRLRYSTTLSAWIVIG